MKRLTSVITACMIVASCGVDQKKFDATYRAGKTLQAAVDNGVNYITYNALTQAFATELSIAKDHAKGSSETRLVKSYEDASGAYHDALVIWQLRMQMTGDWVISGPTVEKLLAPYHVTYEDAPVAGFKRVPADATRRLIWKAASAKLDTANSLLLGR